MSRRIKWTVIEVFIWILVSACFIFWRCSQIEQHYIAGISCNYYLAEENVGVTACMNSEVQQDRWYTLSEGEFIMDFPEEVDVVSLLLQLNPIQSGQTTGMLVCNDISWILDNDEIIYQSSEQQLERLAESSRVYNGDVYWDPEQEKLIYKYNIDDIGRIYFDSSIIQTMEGLARDGLEYYNSRQYINAARESCIISILFLSFCIIIYCLKGFILQNKGKILVAIGVGAVVGLYLWTPVDADSISIEYEVDNVPESTIIIYTTKDSDEIWNEVSLIKNQNANLKISVSDIDLNKNIIIEFRDLFLENVLFRIKSLSIETKNQELYHFTREEMEGLFDAFSYTDGVNVISQYDDGLGFLIDTSSARITIPVLQTNMQVKKVQLYERNIIRKVVLQKSIILFIIVLLMWGTFEMLNVEHGQKDEVNYE